jgi:hypothetical protein
MRRLALALALLPLGASGALAAQECPASSPAQMDAIVQAIVAAPGCGPAYRIMEACAFGSSADVQTGAAVVEKCEPGIPPRLKAAFERERAACVAKYAKQDGTIYRSMAAFCVAKAAAEHARQGGGDK